MPALFELNFLLNQTRPPRSPMNNSRESNLGSNKLHEVLSDLKCPFIRVVDTAGLTGRIDRYFWIVTPGPQVIASLH